MRVVEWARLIPLRLGERSFPVGRTQPRARLLPDASRLLAAGRVARRRLCPASRGRYNSVSGKSNREKAHKAFQPRMLSEALPWRTRRITMFTLLGFLSSNNHTPRLYFKICYGKHQAFFCALGFSASGLWMLKVNTSPESYLPDYVFLYLVKVILISWSIIFNRSIWSVFFPSLLSKQKH